MSSMKCMTTSNGCYKLLAAIEMVSYLVNSLPNKEKLRMAKMFFFSRQCTMQVSEKL